ncbi:MAG: PfkB family carbohydrate kinase [Spirochaetaceae bacterium]|nr:PfkB family carbohydrate kinase [Spirochaetaceae bacterium]
MKVACFSVASMDYFPQQKAYSPGGNALNQSIIYKKLGHDTAFLGALGEDKSGKVIKRLLEQACVDLTGLVIKKGITACNQLVNDEEGERFGVDGQWQNGVYGDFLLEEKHWEHIKDFDIWSTHANGPNYLEALKRKGPSQFLSVDFLHLTDYDLLKQSLNTVDIAFFGGTKEMVKPLAEIAKGFEKPIVLTLGAHGSQAFYKDEHFFQPALPLERVIDTTGCGDSFQAAFTSEYIKSHDIPKALFAGAETGRETAKYYGAIHWP